MNVLTISLILLGSLGPIVRADDDNLKSWLNFVSVFNNNCEEGQVVDGNPQEFVKIVKCDSQNAIYNYKFEGKGGKKFKKGSQFNGFGVLEFSNHGEHGKYNFGMRFGKCIKLNIRGSKKIKKISGNFVNDHLDGRVVIVYKNDDQAVGFARNGILVGILRNFDLKSSQKPILINVTDITGQPLWLKEENYFRFTYKSDGIPRTLVITSDGDQEVMDCEQQDKTYMFNCFEVKEMKTAQDNCQVQIKEMVKAEERFHFRTDTLQKFRPGLDDPFFFCKNSQFNSENVRGNLETWLNTVGNFSANSLWMLHTDEEPFEDDDNPEIRVELNHFKARASHMVPSSVEIKNSRDVLWRGQWQYGELEAKLSPDQVVKSDWKSPVMIDFKKNVGDKSLRGISIASERDLTYGHVLMGSLKKGRLHGLTRMFGKYANDQTTQCGTDLLESGLSFIGYFENGIPTGYCWRGLVGGAWLFGQVDNQGEFSGTGNIFYIYPDLSTAISGTFEKGLLVKGQKVEVIGERCEKGIKVLQFSEPSGPEFHYEPPTKSSFGDQPDLRDPLDDKYVYLKNSEAIPAAGEGTFAKVDIPKNTVFVTYSGHKYMDSEMAQYRLEASKKINESDDKAAAELEVYNDWKYRISLAVCKMTIDIPGKYEPTELYQASLGHKLNHKFNPNTVFYSFESPRFGIVMGEKTKVDVKKDEELYVSYGYQIQSAPEWYKVEYNKFAEEFPELASKLKFNQTSSKPSNKDEDQTEPLSPEQMNIENTP